MNVSPPIRWRDVPTGAVVLYGIPRTVLVNTPLQGGRRGVMLEGFPAFWPADNDTVRLVLLDDADAVANLAAAGLTIEPIGE